MKGTNAGIGFTILCIMAYILFRGLSAESGTTGAGTQVVNILDQDYDIGADAPEFDLLYLNVGISADATGDITIALPDPGEEWLGKSIFMYFFDASLTYNILISNYPEYEPVFANDFFFHLVKNTVTGGYRWQI